MGMGQELADAFPSARQVFEEVDDALSTHLSRIMWDGPMDELTLTANTQPALMATSIAVIRALENEFDIFVTKARYVAGHSLGEYSALCAAGALPLGKTAQLLRLRGEAMQAAVPVGKGAMAALLGASIEDAQKSVDVGQEQGVCQIANDNAPGQIVISGDKAAVAAAGEYAKTLGIKKVIPLSVSAPFHCDLMQPAADVMQAALAETQMANPIVPVVNNVQAQPIQDAAILRQDLVKQVTGRVRWLESVQWMVDNGEVDTFAEPGSGKVLTVMLRRIAKQVEGIALSTPDDLEAFAKRVKG